MALNLGTKIVMIFICTTFAFSILPRACNPLESSTDINSCYGYGTGINKIQQAFGGNTAEQSTAITLIESVLAGTAVVAVAATLIFPNPYIIFATVSGALLSIFISTPWDVVSYTNVMGIPSMISNLFIVIYAFMIGIAVLSFYKGSDF